MLLTGGHRDFFPAKWTIVIIKWKHSSPSIVCGENSSSLSARSVLRVGYPGPGRNSSRWPLKERQRQRLSLLVAMSDRSFQKLLYTPKDFKEIELLRRTGSRERDSVIYYDYTVTQNVILTPYARKRTSRISIAWKCRYNVSRIESVIFRQVFFSLVLKGVFFLKFRICEMVTATLFHRNYSCAILENEKHNNIVFNKPILTCL